MNVGIIVYSQTGNTLSVAQKLKGKLERNGHSVALEQITASGGKPGEQVSLLAAPQTSGYDAVIFGAPVQAFSLCSVMKAYLAQIAPLQCKSTYCFVTQQLPRPWLGGNKAIRTMKQLCQAKDSTVTGTGIINWSGKERDSQIEAVTDKLSTP